MCCSALGLTVIVGWHAGLTWIVQVWEGTRPTPYGTAVGFLLLGAALVALARAHRNIVWLLAIAVVLDVMLFNAVGVGGPDWNDRAFIVLIVTISLLTFTNTVAFGRRCIPAGCVAPSSNIARYSGRRALPAGRLGALGASPYL